MQNHSGYAINEGRNDGLLRRMTALLCAAAMLLSSCGTALAAESPAKVVSDPLIAPKPAPSLLPSATPETGAEPTPAPGEEEETVFEAGSLEASGDGWTAVLSYPAEARIPSDASLEITELKGGDLYSRMKTAAVLLKNDAASPFRRELDNGNNHLFTARIIGTDGSTLAPQAEVTLTYRNGNHSARCAYFGIGEEAKLLEADGDGTIRIRAYQGEAFGYATVEQVQVGTVTLTHNDRDYMVTASYGPDAGFPVDTGLKVREIRPGTAEYALYSGMTDEALNEDWNEITLERYFDIAFVSGGEELEPQADVDVQITFRDKIELTEEHDVQAVHIENNEATVIESDTDSTRAARHDAEAIDTVAFTSDSFSVYGIVQRKKITKKVLAADGNTYEIEVSYGQDAEIPENAEIRVTEIEEGSDLWEAYRRQTAAALNADDVRLPGLYDISIIAEDGGKVEPKTPVSVAIRLANAESGEELQIVHFTEDMPQSLIAEAEGKTEQTEVRTEDPSGDNEPENTEAAQAELQTIASERITASVDGDTVTFETAGFSVYAFAYTVDFHYEGTDYSIEGNSQILLSELIPILNIRVNVTEESEGELLNVNDVESVTFTDEHLVTVQQVSGLITYNGTENKDVGEKDFLLSSLEPFTSDEVLRLFLEDGSVVKVNVTDAQATETTDLNKLVKEVSITTNSGESAIENGNKIVTTKNETYNLKFVFQETNALQYDNDAELVYNVPAGVTIKNPNGTFDVTIGTRVVTGNTYEIVTNSDGSQQLKFKFNTSHKNFRYINTSPDLEITRIFTAEFSDTVSEVKFGSDGTFGFSTQVEDKHNAKVAKYGWQDNGKMLYKVVIASQYGDSENINVKDTLSGTALNNASISNIYYSNEWGNYSSNYTNGYTNNNASNGFDITLSKVEKDKYVTIEYTADIDYSKIANNGNAVFSETGNTVNISVPGDNDTSDNTATHEEKGIYYSSVSKVSTATSDVMTEDSRKYRIVTWKVVANKEQIVSLAGSNITDKLLNNNEVEYYGNGITVTKILDQTTGTPVKVEWSNVGVNDKTNAESWSYPITDNDNASYEITYQTKVDITDWSQGKELVNVAKTKYAEDTGKVYIQPDKTGSTDHSKPVTVNKVATTVNAETITWKIAVNVPAGQSYSPLKIVDTLPALSTGAYSDYLESVSVDGYTEGTDYSYTKTEKLDGNKNIVGDDKVTIVFPNIQEVNSNRTINITIVTRNNPGWMEYADANEWAVLHSNSVDAYINNQTQSSDSNSDGASPKKQSIQKKYEQSGTFNVYEGYDQWKNPILKATVPIYRFVITLTGVNTDSVQIKDVFNSEIFEMLSEKALYGQYTDYLDVGYSNFNHSFSRAEEKASYSDGTVTISNLPRTDGNAFYGYYNVVCYLYVKPEKLDAYKALIAENGSAIDGTNITSKQYTFTNVAEWEGAKDTADFSAKIENLLNKAGSYDNNTGKYHYAITFNPEKLQVNGNINYDLTDTLQGVAIERNSISVTAVTSSGSTVAFKTYSSVAEANVDADFEGIQVVYPDNSTTLNVYEIPDKTSIVITYDAVPSGDATIDTNAKKAIVEAGNTVNVLDYRYSVSDRHEYDFINKIKTEGENNSRTFTIDLNPGKLKVNGGSAYELTDTYTGNLVITGDTPATTFTVTADPETATVGTESVNVANYIKNHITKSDSTYSFMIPDEVHVTIVYTGNLDFQAGSDGSVNAHYTNTATSKSIPVTIDENIESKILTKNAGGMATSGDDAGYIPFEIIFNPLGQVLNNNEMIELKDDYTNLLVDYSSISVSTVPADRASLVEYDYSDTVGTYKVPDGTKIILTYKARPDFSKGNTVQWSNTVTAAGYSDNKGGTSTFSSDGSGRGSLGNILWLYKYETGHMERPLNAITFELYMDVNGTMTPVTKTDGSQVTFTTKYEEGKGDGFAYMSLEDGVNAQFQDGSNGFKEDTIYYLKEVTQPDGYYKNNIIYNFVIHEGQESAYTAPSYKSGERIYLFGKEDIVKVTNTKITDGVSVTKKWVNANGSTTWPDGIDSVSIKIQKKVGDADPVDMTGANVPSYYWDSANNTVITGEDGTTWSDTRTLTSNNPSDVWSKLDTGDNISYIVTETAINGNAISGTTATINDKTYEIFTGAVNNGSATIINAEKTSVTVNKTWGEGIESSNYEVKVKLIQKVDGVENASFTIENQEKTLNSSNWTATWNNLSTSDCAGHILTYDVEETEVYLTSDSSTNLVDNFTATKTVNADGSITIENSEKQAKRLTVTKNWVDQNNNAIPGSPIEFQLIRTGGSRGSGTTTATIYINEAYSGETLDKITQYSSGESIHVGDTVNIEGVGWWGNFNANTSYISSGYYSINGIGTNAIQITVSDRNVYLYLQRNKTPSNITKKSGTSGATNTTSLELVFNAETGAADSTKTYTLSSENGWTLTFNNLPTEDEEGNEYKYTVHEVTTGDFTTEISPSTAIADGTITIINKKTVAYTSMKVKKAWTKNGTAVDTWPTGAKVYFNVYGVPVDENADRVLVYSSYEHNQPLQALTDEITVSNLVASSYVSFVVEEDTEQSTLTGYTFNANTGVYDSASGAYIITNDYTEIEAWKTWDSSYSLNGTEQVTFQLYSSTEAPVIPTNTPAQNDEPTDDPSSGINVTVKVIGAPENADMWIAIQDADPNTGWDALNGSNYYGKVYDASGTWTRTFSTDVAVSSYQLAFSKNDTWGSTTITESSPIAIMDGQEVIIHCNTPSTSNPGSYASLTIRTNADAAKSWWHYNVNKLALIEDDQWKHEIQVNYQSNNNDIRDINVKGLQVGNRYAVEVGSGGDAGFSLTYALSGCVWGDDYESSWGTTYKTIVITSSDCSITAIIGSTNAKKPDKTQNLLGILSYLVPTAYADELPSSSETNNITPATAVSGTTITLDGTTDDNGEYEAWKAKWSYLPTTDSEGNKIYYYVQETDVRVNNLIVDNSAEYSYEYGKDADNSDIITKVTINNTPDITELAGAYISIIKSDVVDEADNSINADNTFTFLVKEGEEVKATLNVKKGQTATTGELELGKTYTIEETADNRDISGYDFNNVTLSHNSVELTSSGVVTVTAVNHYTKKMEYNTVPASITVNKVDQNGHALNGATFELFSDKELKETAIATYTDQTFTINSSDDIIMNALDGHDSVKLYLKEKSSPEKHELIDKTYEIELTKTVSGPTLIGDTFVTTTSYSIKVDGIIQDADEKGNSVLNIENPIQTTELTINKKWFVSGAELTSDNVLPNASIKVRIDQSTDDGTNWTVVKTKNTKEDGTEAETELKDIVLTKADNWTKSWTLPAYANDDNLTPIKYRVVETEAKLNDSDELDLGDTILVVFKNGVATLRNTLPTTSITVAKAWEKDESTDWPDGIESVTFGIYNGTTAVLKDGTAYQLTFGKDAAEASRTFSDLPMYDDAGTRINYTIKEESVKPTTGDAAAVSNGAVSVAGETWIVMDAVTDKKTGVVTITNTQNANKVFVEKRWYDAYGNLNDNVNIPVTVELHKADGTFVETRQINGGTRAAFTVQDESAEYYVVETSSFTGFMTMYTAEPMDKSRDNTKQNDNERYLGQQNGSEVKVSVGNTLYVMNTATQSTDQIVAHKKWIEFQDKNGQFYLGQLDGANTANERKQMQLDIQMYYDVTDLEGNKLASKLEAIPVVRVWEPGSGHAFDTKLVDNLIIPGEKLAFNYIGDWHWGFRENSGSGQAGGAGMLPQYGYYNDNGTWKLVKYSYYYDELKVYDGSTHGVYNWDNPEDVTNNWWKLIASNTEGNEVRTNIENRPKKLPVTKEWKDENGNSLMATEEDLKNISSITVYLYGSKTATSEGADDWTLVDTLVLSAENNWKGTFDLKDEAGWNYKVEEVWDESYKRNGLSLSQNTQEGTLSNTLMPTGSIKVLKTWGESGDTGAKAVLFKLKRIANNTSADTTDVYEHPAKYGLTDANLYTDGTNKYIRLNKTEVGEWPELQIDHLLTKLSTAHQPGGQDGMLDNVKYYVEEAGYIDANNVMQQIPTEWTVEYSGGEDNGGKRVAKPDKTNPVTLTVKNTVPETKGSITVTKVFSGLPEGANLEDFKITASWTEGDESKQIELTIPKNDTVTMPNGVTFSGSGTDESPYSWTIADIPIGAEVTVTEEGYNGVAGYIWSGTVKVGDADAVSGMSTKVTVASETANVAFVNTYTAGVELPSTGGSGTVLYTATGALLMLLAAMLLVSRKRKYNR